VEPYNAVLGIKHLVEDSELTFCLDNEALLSSCAHGLRLPAPRFSDLNYLISNAISGITTCLRFPGQLNTGLMKLAVNAVPFPRLHFMIPSYAPLLPRKKMNANIPSQVPVRVKDMIRELMHPRCRMVAADTRRGKFLTATSIFRGRMSTREVENSLKLIKDKNSKQFVNWIPDNAKIAICDIPPRGLKRAATFFSNNTSIASVWVRILEQYRAMYRRRAYLHWYFGEGMEESDFELAETTLLDLIDEYIPLSSNSFRNDDDDGDGGDDDIDADFKGTGKGVLGAGYPAQGDRGQSTRLTRANLPDGTGDGGGGRRRGRGGGGNERIIDDELAVANELSKGELDRFAEAKPEDEFADQRGSKASDKTPSNIMPESAPKTSLYASSKTSKLSNAEVEEEEQGLAKNAAASDDEIAGKASGGDVETATYTAAFKDEMEDSAGRRNNEAEANDLPIRTQPSWDQFYRKVSIPDERAQSHPQLQSLGGRGALEGGAESTGAVMDDQDDLVRRPNDLVAGNEADVGKLNNDDADDADDDDFLSRFVSDIKTRKRKSQESHEFDRIMERHNHDNAGAGNKDDDDEDDDF